MWPQGPSVLHTPEQEPNCWSYVQVVASPWQCWVGCSRRMNARLSSFSILFSVCGDSSVAVFSYWLFCNLLLIKIVISCLFSCQENPLCTTCTLPSSSIFFFFQIRWDCHSLAQTVQALSHGLTETIIPQHNYIQFAAHL